MGGADMLDKVAEAIWNARESTFPKFTRLPISERMDNSIYLMASAAIGAMTNPTPELLRAIRLGPWSEAPPGRDQDMFELCYRRGVDTAHALLWRTDWSASATDAAKAGETGTGSTCEGATGVVGDAQAQSKP